MCSEENKTQQRDSETEWGLLVPREGLSEVLLFEERDIGSGEQDMRVFVGR